MPGVAREMAEKAAATVPAGSDGAPLSGGVTAGDGAGPAPVSPEAALFLGAFFDELVAWGVRRVVVSPGSRSTPLAMVAFELHRRHPELLHLYVDVDERGAAFMALGMAKAEGVPACAICTSGTAAGNYYPAVLEAESSRVPLLLLTADRPPRLQGLGAPQTMDQLELYGGHVRAFRAMPLPSADGAAIAFARQAAREAVIASGAEASGSAGAFAGSAAAGEGTREGTGTGAGAGSVRCSMSRDSVSPMPLAGYCQGGPVQLNFPFDDPLKPDLSVPGLFETGRAAGRSPAFAGGARGILEGAAAVSDATARAVGSALSKRRSLVLAGEGSCRTLDEARELLAWARSFDLPLLADPLSGLRCLDDPLIIDNYDSVFGSEGEALPDVVVRFGRWPVSKRATVSLAAARPLQVVVDAFETRDCNVATDLFVRAAPLALARGMLKGCPEADDRDIQHAFARRWIERNEAVRGRLGSPAKGTAQRDANDCGARDLPFEGASQRAAGADAACCDAAGAGAARDLPFEGAVISEILRSVPEGSCLFAANSMSVRAIDTFLLRGSARCCVLANRGLNGIDGTVSTAAGAAAALGQVTLITGDLTLLHDANALALSRELAARCGDDPAPSLAIVLLNNDGGGIFDMLPQRSDEDYFERLFLTPQGVGFEQLAGAFGVAYARAASAEEAGGAYQSMLGRPGISLVEVRVPLRGVRERYQPYWRP